MLTIFTFTMRSGRMDFSSNVDARNCVWTEGGKPARISLTDALEEFQKGAVVVKFIGLLTAGCFVNEPFSTKGENFSEGGNSSEYFEDRLSNRDCCGWGLVVSNRVCSNIEGIKPCEDWWSSTEKSWFVWLNPFVVVPIHSFWILDGQSDPVSCPKSSLGFMSSCIIREL